MLPNNNGLPWIDAGEKDSLSEYWNTRNPSNKDFAVADNSDESGVLSRLRNMLGVEEDWYVKNIVGFQPNPTQLAHHLVDSSSSCSISPSSSLFSNLNPVQLNYLISQSNTPAASSLSSMSGNPLDDKGFDLGAEVSYLGVQAPNALDFLNRAGGLLGGFSEFSSNNQNQMVLPNLSSEFQLPTSRFLHLPESNAAGLAGFQCFNDSATGFAQAELNTAILQKSPLENDILGLESAVGLNRLEGDKGKRVMGEEKVQKMKMGSGEGLVDVSVDGSAMNYDSDEFTENNEAADSGKNGGNSLNEESTVTDVKQKGKKKGMPAKNLMAERRRRKKLNDRLYSLRIAVPRISKMDRASILGDAIEYLKELQAKIDNLQKELDTTPCSSSLTPASSFNPLTSAPATPTNSIKDDLCPSWLQILNGQPARVEVRVCEGGSMNIHMYCSYKPGIELSTMRALEKLGINVQLSTMTCYGGFALDIFRAELRKQGQALHPDQIRAALLESAAFPIT